MSSARSGNRTFLVPSKPGCVSQRLLQSWATFLNMQRPEACSTVCYLINVRQVLSLNLSLLSTVLGLWARMQLAHMASRVPNLGPHVCTTSTLTRLLSRLPYPVYVLSSPGSQMDGFHLLAAVNNETLKYKVLCDTRRCEFSACSRFVCLSCSVSCNNIGILTSICSYQKQKRSH